MTLGFALASLGFGLFRPGFTSGASLAVEPHEQNAVAGMVTSVNGVAFIAGAGDRASRSTASAGRCPSSLTGGADARARRAGPRSVDALPARTRREHARAR